MTPRVSIVCVTHDRKEHVLKCLDSCKRQDYPGKELVVLINACTDGSEAAIREQFPEAKVLRTHTNLGAFPAKNLAIANADGEYVMIVDDDAYFLDEHGLSQLVQAFEREPELGAVTCAIEGPHEEPVPSEDRYVANYKDGFTLFPKKVFTEWVSYYPDIFYRSAGEAFLCTALWDMGKRVKQLAHTRMFHARTTQGRSSWDWKYYGLRSQILVMFMRDPWFLVPPRVLSKFVRSFIRNTLRGGLGAWICAWTSALVHLPVAMRWRRPIRWSTQTLLWKLRAGQVTDVSKWERVAARHA